MVNGALPDGWKLESVKRIGEVVTGTTPSKAIENYYGNDFPFYKPTDLDAGFFTKDSRDGLSSLGIQKARLLPEKSVLVTCIGATIGKTGLIRAAGASNQQINAIIPNESIIPEYLYYACVSPIFQKSIQDSASATTLPILNKSKFEQLLIPVAPLSEQERIVAKIEELFTQLEAGTSALAKVQAGLRRYKASVLKAAVEGKLVESGKAESGDLPDGWRLTTVGEIGEISGGLTKNSKRDVLKKKMPYLRVANVYANELHLDDVSEIGVEEKEIKRALLQEGDLLVVEGNGSPDQIGRVAIWNGSIAPCLHQNHIIKVRFEPKEVAEYVLYWLLSEGGREQITNVASSTSGLYTLSLSKVSNLPIPLPPLEEQRRIVAEVERRLSVAREVEVVTEKALARASRLRQAVLRSAFEGRLAPSG